MEGSPFENPRGLQEKTEQIEPMHIEDCMTDLYDNKNKWIRFLKSRFRFSDDGVVEDIISASYIKVVEKFKQLRDVEVLHTWFYSILNNTAKDYLRTASHRRTDQCEVAPNTHGLEFVDSQPDPLSRLLEENKREVIRHFINIYCNRGMVRNPDRDREILTQIYLNGVASDSVARDFNINKNSLKVKCYRFREFIRKQK